VASLVVNTFLPSISGSSASLVAACWEKLLTTLPPSCADWLEIWEPQPPGTLRACPGLSWDWFTLHIKIGLCSIYIGNKEDTDDE
jgi:hypothetical protein